MNTTLSETELRELDAWIYRNVPGLKICKCVNWIQPKFGQSEYKKIRRVFLAQGSKDRWPELEPDLPCTHQDEYSTTAAAMQVLGKCIERMGGTLIAFGKQGDDFIICLPGYDKEIMKAKTLPLAICLFSKQLFSK